MADVFFLVILGAVAFALAMRQSGLWAYAGLALIGWLGYATGLVHGSFEGLSLSFGSILAFIPVAALIALSIPGVRRSVLVEPAYGIVRKILPKVSETEQQALDAGTIGFDAELFSGQPSWAKQLDRK